MATPVQNVARPAVIRVSPLEGRSGAAMEILRAFPAWIISAGIHGLLFFVFYLVVKDQAALAGSKPDRKEDTFNTKVETSATETILTNVDLGINPETPTNFDVNRISEHDVSVPGPVEAGQAEGIAGAPEGPPVTVPAPPGSGNGQGGVPFDDLDG